MARAQRDRASGFLSTVNASAIVTVLPIIQQELGTDIVTIGLTLTIYQLITASLLLAFGRLGDLRGQRRIFLTGPAIFLAGSALCGLAPTVETLIGARAVQALGAAMVFSNSIAILVGAFGTGERGRAIGAASVFTYSGLTAGPPLAGFITDAVGWRGIFVLSVSSASPASRSAGARCRPTAKLTRAGRSIYEARCC